MEKNIVTIGYKIPTFDKNEVDFYDGKSLMDADILLMSPDALEPRGHWVSFTVRDGGCFDVDASRTYKQKLSHLRKEIKDHLDAGKSVFVLLAKKEDYSLSSGVSTEKKGMTTYHSDTANNYDFLPIDLGRLTSASGNHIEFSGNALFSDFYEKFNKSLEYRLYIEGLSEGARAIFTGKDKTKVLGAIYKAGKGHLIALPFIGYDEKKFTEYKGKGEKQQAYWTKEAIQFGKSLFKVLVDIDKALQKGGDKTPPPDWVNDKKFQSAREKTLQKDIEVKSKTIESLVSERDGLLVNLDEEVNSKDLLFEKGKRLENAISAALTSLGYTAENFNDGSLEIDHVITSPEGERFIGEAEGKDTSAVGIDKFSQLTRIVQEDLKREEIEEPATGILFGNGFRLTELSVREEQFTTKCITTAKSLNYILVRTSDLFWVAKYVEELNDHVFAKSCRDALKGAVGGIVNFPDIPKKKVVPKSIEMVD